MIIVDGPVKRRFHGDRCWTAHVLSDVAGHKGTYELIHFARAIGLRAAWIQRKGHADEHFDLIGQPTVRRALDAGARVVSNPALVSIIRAKREVLHA